MSQDKESTSSSGKAHKRYVYLNKFLDFKEETTRKLEIVEKHMSRTRRNIRWLVIGLSGLTIILSLLAYQLIA